MPRSVPELPSLDAGTYRLTTSAGVGPLASLVCDHLLAHDGTARWVDAAGHARSDVLARLAPSRRLLDRVRVARGVTAFQHLALVDAAADAVDDPASEATALVVAPAVDHHYHDADLQAGERDRLLRAVADRLAALADDRPVLVTTRGDDVPEPLDGAVDHDLVCERTPFGPRFAGDEFETLVYETAGPGVQTTLAFWARVLAARQAARPSTEVTARGAH